MYRFVSAIHVLLNSSLDMLVYLINEYIYVWRMSSEYFFWVCDKAWVANSFPLIYQAARFFLKYDVFITTFRTWITASEVENNFEDREGSNVVCIEWVEYHVLPSGTPYCKIRSCHNWIQFALYMLFMNSKICRVWLSSYNGTRDACKTWGDNRVLHINVFKLSIKPKNHTFPL